MRLDTLNLSRSRIQMYPKQLRVNKYRNPEPHNFHLKFLTKETVLLSFHTYFFGVIGRCVLLWEYGCDR